MTGDVTLVWLVRHLAQFSESFNAIYGEFRLCTEKRFSLACPCFNAESDSVNHTYVEKSIEQAHVMKNGPG